MSFSLFKNFIDSVNKVENDVQKKLQETIKDTTETLSGIPSFIQNITQKPISDVKSFFSEKAPAVINQTYQGIKQDVQNITPNFLKPKQAPMVFPVDKNDPAIQNLLQTEAPTKPFFGMKSGQQVEKAAEFLYPFNTLSKFGLGAAREVVGKKEPFYPQSALSKIVFGNEPVQTAEKQVRGATEFASKLGGAKQGQVTLPGAVFGGIGLGLMGGLEAVPGVGGAGKKVGKEIVEEGISKLPKLSKELPLPLYNMKVEIESLKESLNEMPGKQLMKYVSKTTGELPEVTGVSTMKSLTGSGKTVKSSQFAQKGDQIVQNLVGDITEGGDLQMAQKLVNDYKTTKLKLSQLENTYKNELLKYKDQKFIDDIGIKAEKEKQKLIEQSLKKNKTTPRIEKLVSEKPDILSNTVKRVSKESEQKVQELSAKFDDDFSFENIVTKDITNVKDKINILDKIRTPEHVMKKIGMEKEMDLIRTQYDKYIKELPEEIEKVRNWAEKTTPEENKNIFKYLDGQGVQLSEKEQKIANEVKSYLKDWADKLKLPKENRISNYITHIFDKDFSAKEFPQELAKIIDEKVAGSVYDPFTLKRLGAKGYKEDTWLALEAYVKRGTRKYNMDVALEEVKKKAKTLELSQFKYVKNFVDRINMRPTEIDTMLDNTIKSVIGYKLGQRPTAAISKTARQIIYRGALGLNFSSALKNLSQGANTYAKLGEKYTLIGYTDLLKNWKTGELEKVGVLADDFIQDKTLSVYKKGIQKLDKVLFSMFQAAEKINRGAAYFGAKAKAINKGMNEEEAIKYAKKIVRETQFSFGSIDTPPILQSDIGKTLGQFQSFSIKQGEFLAGMIKEKDIAGLARWIGASLTFIYTVGQAFGMSPKDLVPLLRIGTPPTLQLPIETVKAAVGAPNEYGQPTGKRELLRAATPIFPAGVQIKKTVQGLGDFLKGTSETDTGRVRFDVEKDPANLLRSILFGRYGTKEGKEYIKKEKSPVSRTTYNAQSLLEGITNANTVEEKQAIITEAQQSGKLNKDVIDEMKDILKEQALNLSTKDKELKGYTVEKRAEIILKELQKSGTQEEKTQKIKEWQDKGILTKDVIESMKVLLNR